MHNPVNDKRIFKPLPLGLNSEYDRWLASPQGIRLGGHYAESWSWLKWQRNKAPVRVLLKNYEIGFRIARNK